MFQWISHHENPYFDSLYVKIGKETTEIKHNIYYIFLLFNIFVLNLNVACNNLERKLHFSSVLLRYFCYIWDIFKILSLLSMLRLENMLKMSRMTEKWRQSTRKIKLPNQISSLQIKIQRYKVILCDNDIGEFTNLLISTISTILSSNTNIWLIPSYRAINGPQINC